MEGATLITGKHVNKDQRGGVKMLYNKLFNQVSQPASFFLGSKSMQILT